MRKFAAAADHHRERRLVVGLPHLYLRHLDDRRRADVLPHRLQHRALAVAQLDLAEIEGCVARRRRHRRRRTRRHRPSRPPLSNEPLCRRRRKAAATAAAPRRQRPLRRRPSRRGSRHSPTSRRPLHHPFYRPPSPEARDRYGRCGGGAGVVSESGRARRRRAASRRWRQASQLAPSDLRAQMSAAAAVQRTIEGTVEGLTARRRAEGGAEGVGIKREEGTLEEGFDDGPDQAVGLRGGEVRGEAGEESQGSVAQPRVRMAEQRRDLPRDVQ